MAFDINYFLKINNTYGTNSKKDVQLHHLKNHVNDRFADTIDCYRVNVNGEDRDLLIIKTVKNNEKTIKSRPDETFEVGDYVTFDNNTWLITEKDECNQAYTTGKMKITNWTLKFQALDGTILSYPCIVENATKYDNGENEGKIITVGSSQHLVTLPFDVHTINLRTPRRVYLDKHPTDPISYKITQNDSTTLNFGDKGLIILSLTQDMTRTDKDRPDLGVCDYFTPTTPPSQDETIILSYSTITCSNPNNTLTLGATRTLTPKFYNEDIEVTDINAVWNIELPEGFENQFTITYVGNQVRIRTNDNTKLLGKTVLAKVSDINGDYSSELLLGINSGI